MADFENKENVAPFTSSDPLLRMGPSPEKKTNTEGRSETMGADEIDKSESVQQDAKIRCDFAFVLGCKPIISTDTEKAGRQAVRRRILADRRVSFAPEATLHTWDVIEFQSDETTSPDSSEQTRRSGNGVTPFKQLDPLSWDNEDPPSSPPEQQDESEWVPSAPAPHCHFLKKQGRHSSEFPSTNYNDPRDELSGSAANGSTTCRRRRRTITEAGSPGAEVPAIRSKRSRRSLVPRSFMGENPIDLTMAMSSNRDAALSARRECRRSAAKRRSPSTVLKPGVAAVHFTRAVRVVEAAAARVEPTTSSTEENEELITVPEGIKAAERATTATVGPATPLHSLFPAINSVNTPPREQERFKDLLNWV
ncbi:hypothetical protein B0A55_10850 [Friedmanniomyces simplex]|uniref:Uncharacterized protein n=1 Tax=Friedmanniomyces simplex TaxID=329884 RepID=A0A4U0X2H3_9PEZI|nr:hypothetical protein B0A55_10850 [Friedmanniomyces simplex]